MNLNLSLRESRRSDESLKWQWADGIYVCSMLALFYLATAITAQLGIDSRNFTIPIRLLTAGFGLVGILILANQPKRARMSAWSKLLLIFLAVYLLRVAWDEVTGRSSDFRDGSSILALFILTTLIPSIYWYARPMPSEKVCEILWVFMNVVCVFLFYSYRGIAAGAEGLRSSGVMESFGVINPIVVGHMGAFLFEISLYLFFFTQRKLRWLYLVGSWGVVLIVMSGSRGPILALCAVITLLIYAKLKRVFSDPGKLFAYFGLIASMLFAVVFYIISSDSILLSRMVKEDDFGSGREFLYGECIRAAVESPIFGRGVFIIMPDGRLSGSESFVLDGFLATGLIFGGLWICVLVYAVIKGLRLFVGNPSFWLILVFMHGMFFFGLSGGLVASSWGLAGVFAVLRLAELCRFSPAHRNMGRRPLPIIRSSR